MKKAPFNLEAALRGDKLVTRDGRKVNAFRKREKSDSAIGHRSDWPYCANVQDSQNTSSYTCITYTSTGHQGTTENQSKGDLFLLIEEPAEGELVLPEGYAEGDWSFYNSAGYHAVSNESGTIAQVLHAEGERGWPSEKSHKTAQLIALAPRMADEIKRLREENARIEILTEANKTLLTETEALKVSLKHFEALAQSHYLTILDMQNEREERKALTPDRATIATAALQGLLANSNVVGHNANHGWGLVNCTMEQVSQVAIMHADAHIGELLKNKPIPE